MRSCLLILILISGLVHGAEITVGPKDADYRHIQNAIDNATIGDTIEVQSGIYRERLQIAKAINLIGVNTGNGQPVVNGSGSGSVFTLIANGTKIEGFNITGSGHCGCGNAGIQVISGGNLVRGNIFYKNKYGIYVTPGCPNNTFISNDFIENEIAAYDLSNNSWDGSKEPIGIQKMMEYFAGKQIIGNHYSDYDEPGEGCNDTNKDGICDIARKIEGGISVDVYPSIISFGARYME